MIVEQLKTIFSTREQALFIWLAIALITILFSNKIRGALGSVIKAFFSWKIQASILAATIYTAVPIITAYLFKIWDFSLFKDAIYWLIGSAVVTMFGLSDSKDQEGKFRKMFRNTLKLIIVVQFFASYHKYSMTAELILLPVLVFFSLMLGMSQTDTKYKKVENLIQGIFFIMAVAFIVYAIIDITNKPRELANISKLKSFLQPVFLSIWFIPFAFVMAVYMRYENIFVRLGFFMKDRRLRRYTKRRILWKGKLNLKKIKELSSSINWLYDKSTKEDVKKQIN